MFTCLSQAAINSVSSLQCLRKNTDRRERKGFRCNEWGFCNEQLEMQLICFIQAPAADCMAMWDPPWQQQGGTMLEAVTNCGVQDGKQRTWPWGGQVCRPCPSSCVKLLSDLPQSVLLICQEAGKKLLQLRHKILMEQFLKNAWIKQKSIQDGGRVDRSHKEPLASENCECDYL